MEAQNLDAMDIGDLSKFIGTCRTLIRYAKYRQTSTYLQLNGRIAESQRANETADRLYASLPEWAKW